MKQLFRLCIILLVSFIGEILAACIPLPVPGSIYGLVLMLIALITGIIPLESVRTVGGFLVEIMPVMFIPAIAGLIDSWVDLKPILLAVFVIMLVSTFVIMGVTAIVTQRVISGRKHAGKEDA